MRIALLTPVLSPADAVSNDVVGMFHVLCCAGHEVEVFANAWTTSAVSPKHPRHLGAFLKGPDSLLIHHYSMGWEPGLAAIRQAPGRTMLRYHNVTPPEFFYGISADHACKCQQGRDQLADFAGLNCDWYLSCSHYSQLELQHEGVPEERCRVLPPYHQVDALQSAQPDTRVLDRCQDGATNILMVGRVSPNKGHLLAVESFALYRRLFNPASRLIFVGKEDPRLAAYADALRGRIAELELKDAVLFTGGVSEEELKAYYLAADAFFITSEHEGFCVPVVEAMALQVPIVALAATAVGETVGDAGITWTQNDPALFAASLHRVNKKTPAGRQLALSGLSRYERHFTNEAIARRFEQVIESIGGRSQASAA